MDLKGFRQYLTDLGRAKKTAYLYASYVRRAVRFVGGLQKVTDETLRAFDDSLPSNQRNVFRTAWRAFVAFGALREVPVPSPAFTNHARDGWLLRKRALMHPCAQSIALLCRVFRPSELETRMWHQVKPSPTGYAISFGESVRFVPAEAILPLATWVFPDRKVVGAAALIPMDPEQGTYASLPAARIATIARDWELAQLSGGVSGEKSAASSPGTSIED